MSAETKISLVTGASRGIGKEVAIGLARQGCTVVIVCRDPGQGRATADEIAVSTGNRRVHSLPADLSSQRAVRQLADAFLAQFPALHILINNAGSIHRTYGLTEDGIERTFAVNHLAPFLLTTLLTDILRRSAPSRIINIVSVTYKFVRLNPETIAHPTHYSAVRAYAESKLANILYTSELARRMESSGVAVACIHPGAVRTNIYSFSLLGRLYSSLWRRGFISPEEGAQPIVELATSMPPDAMHGRYFDRYTAEEPAEHARNTADAKRVWDLSEELTSPARHQDFERHTTTVRTP